MDERVSKHEARSHAACRGVRVPDASPPQALDDERTGAPPASRSTCNAWARVDTGATTTSPADALLRGREVFRTRRRARSRPRSAGTMNTFAPAARAATAFCSNAADLADVPVGSIVPVTATRLPPVRSPGVRSSMIASVMASPADGPLMSLVSTLDLHRELVAASEADADQSVRRALR